MPPTRDEDRMAFDSAKQEHKSILYNLKTTVDTLFLNQGDDLFNVFGGLQRLHSSIEKIFTNGIRVWTPSGSADCWRFIEALNWLNPSMSVTTFSNSRSQYDNCALQWIYENLKHHTLAQKLSWLLSDCDHLAKCYEVTAFFRSEPYVAALFVCLKAVESNQQNLLTQIDSDLYTERLGIPKSNHRRSSSHPEFSAPLCDRGCNRLDYEVDSDSKVMGARQSVTQIDYYENESGQDDSHVDRTLLEQILQTQEETPPLQQYKVKQHQLKVRKSLPGHKEVFNLKLRPWSSVPNIHIVSSTAKHRPRSQTISQPIRIPHQQQQHQRRRPNKLKCFDDKDQSLTVRRDEFFDCSTPNSGLVETNDTATALQPITLIKCDDIEIHFDRRHNSRNNKSPSNWTHCSPENRHSCSGESTGELLLTNCVSNTPVRNRTYLACFESEKSSYPSSASVDFINSFGPMAGEKLYNPCRSMGDVSELDPNVLPMSVSSNPCFPRPMQGQSLASFLQAAQFSRKISELDRENAHFGISEAMISAIEQLKWIQSEQNDQHNQCTEEDAIRTGARKKEWTTLANRANLSKHSRPVGRVFSISDSSSSGSACDSTPPDSSYAEPNSHVVNENLSFMKSLTESQISVSDHTAYAEWGDNVREALSAEGVALSLIAKFSDKHLPRASDLLWLVSEDDAPQQLLPMPPGSWSINPDEIYGKVSALRGTRDWAPPRAQIIFTCHPKPDRQKQIQKQNQRCAGCGMRVAAAYSHRFRYCEYLGKYHCTGCHRNQMSTLPARVLERWDFTYRPVCVFSYRLLEQMWSYPLFRVADLNPLLYQKIKSLRMAKHKRIQLAFIKEFILACRFSESVKAMVDSVPGHLTVDTDLWTMADFVAVKNGSFCKDLNMVIKKCEEHVFACELCSARGFLCEACPRKQTIYPWQHKVKRCSKCGACFHDICYRFECTKCQRVKKRCEDSRIKPAT